MKNPIDILDVKVEQWRQSIFNEINNLSIFHWIRLGICFGLLNWVRYASKSIIAGRAIEKVFTVYQMGIFERENNYTFPELVNNVYNDSFIFESIFIMVVVFGSWILLLWKFGLPRKPFKTR